MATREAHSVAAGNAYRVDVESGEHRWTLDEPPGKGGTDAGPTPVQAMLGALLSCLTISFQFEARRRKVPIDRVEGWVAANELRWIEQVAVELQVWSSAPEADVRALMERAERGCFVSNLLRPDLKYTIDLIVHGAGETPAPD